MENKNQPAFPIQIEYDKRVDGGGTKKAIKDWLGMSKRELIAAMAMQGLCSTAYNPGGGNQLNSLNLAHKAVEIADALLVALEK